MTVTHGDVLRVSANFTLPGPVQYQNIYHYLYDGVGDATDATVISDIEDQLNLAYDELVALVRNDIVPDLSFVDEVQFLTGKWTVTRNVGTMTLVLAGVGGGDALPYQSSPFVTLKTSRPKSVGRKFLFPLSENMQDSTVLTAPAVAAIVGYTDEVLADIVVDLINALHPGIVRTGVDDYLVFQVGVVTNLLGSQRRRRPGSGA